MAVRQSRTELSLNKKIELIKRAESTNLSQRKLAEEFGIGRTQVGSILKRKRDYEDALDRNECGAKRRFTYSSANHEVNRITWEWFIRMRAQNISVTGPMIQQQALSYAADLGLIGFKASNGWLEAFKKRHNIGQSRACTGESTSLDSDIISEWYSKLGRLHEGYGPEDLYNMDEMNCFYRALPDRSLVLCDNDKDGQSVNLSLDKMTVLLCCNMKGNFLPPLVIVKSEMPPSCFKNINITTSSSVQNSPSTVKWNKEGQLTPAQFLEWVSELDVMLGLEQRHILLFLDNAFSSYTQDSPTALNNIKLIFFPASHLQPLDQGIIHHIKVHYRKHLLQHVLTILHNQNSSTVSFIHSNQMTCSTSYLHNNQTSSSVSSFTSNPTVNTTSVHNIHLPEAAYNLNTHMIDKSSSVHNHSLMPGIVSSIISSISVLDALHWVSDALKDVNQAMIFHSFVCAGFPKLLLVETEGGSSLPIPPEDPTQDLEPLIASVAAALSLPDPMSSQEYASLEFITPVSEILSEAWPQDFMAEATDKKPDLQRAANGDNCRPELQHDPSNDICQHEPNNDISSSSPTPKSVIKDVATALYWVQQLKLFSEERAMGDLESTFSQGEEILTKELRSKAE